MNEMTPQLTFRKRSNCFDPPNVMFPIEDHNYTVFLLVELKRTYDSVDSATTVQEFVEIAIKLQTVKNVPCIINKRSFNASFFCD